MFLLDWLKKQARKSAQSSGKNKTKRNNVARTTRSNGKGNNSKQAQTAGKKTVQKTVNTVKRGGVVISNKTAAKIKSEQQKKKKQQSQSLTGTENYKKLQKKREEAAKRGGNRTREQRKESIEATKNRLKHVYEANAKSIADQTKKALEKSQNIDALGVKNGTTTYKTADGKTKKVKNLTSNEYLQLQNAERMPSKKAKDAALGKELSRKVGAVNTATYQNSKGAIGFMEAMNPLPIELDKAGAGTYTKEQKKTIEKAKDSTAYKVGYGLGTVGSFAMTGASGAEKAIGTGIVKAAGKKAGKETIGKVGKFAANRAADVAVSTPFNLNEALKYSKDEKGNLDIKQAAKTLGVNTAADVLIGGAFEGIGKGLSVFKNKADYSKYIKIKAKKEAGAKLTKAEQDFYDKGKRELTNQYIEKEVQKEKEKILNQNNKPVEQKVPEQKINEQKPTNIASGKPIENTRKGVSAEKTENNGVPMHNTEPNVIDDVVANDAEKVIEVESPLKGRDEQAVGNKSTKAYMYENPEVKPYFQEEARAMLADLKNAVKGERGYNDTIGFTGTKRYVDKDIEYLLDEFNYTYDDIEKGLKAIIEDNGAENNAISKRIEFALDERLRNGSDDVLFGGKNPPNEEYNNLLREKQINEYNDANFNEWLRSVAGEKLGKAADEIEWENAAKQAADDAGYSPNYNNAADEIRGENPNPKDFKKKSERISIDEVPRVRQTAAKLVNQADDDVADIMEPWVRQGLLDKKVLETQKNSIEKAKKELADGRLYQNFMDSNVEADEHLFMARAQVLLDDLMKKASNDNQASELLLNVMDKATDASSHAGRLLNATKLLLRNTPEGRLRTIEKEVNNLNEKFSGRLKGKTIELTDEQIERIRKATTEEDIEKVTNDINNEIWEQIPASWFEKFNEIRHTSMLFNPKTHIRNIAGNTVFKAGRTMSDALEIAAYKIPAVKSRLEKYGGKVEMISVSRKEVKDNKVILDEIFDTNYAKADSKNRYIESSRPDGAPVIKNKVANKIIQTNYGLLEKEDMLMFRPEYEKNFVRWCKANDVPLSDISKMSKAQMQKANAFALKQAEYATFRDNSAFASKIVGLKQKTAGKTGKTTLGTAAYRAGNIILESNLPFVKTPVNILRRSVDYSPLGLGRSMIELATAKTADDFMSGIKHLSTGLTGTGIAALGMLLANNDLITVKAGEESGDAYYDRDMGYQDYSLVLKFGNKEYSMSIDWVSPMQTSLFMGATIYNNLADKKLTLEDMFDCLTAVTGPMLDMSFMSSSKDTIETFMEKVYRNGTGDDADWSGAVAQTLFGSVPQGYLNSFVPQLVSQTAQAFDDKQRDTRSTKEDTIAASWDSFSKKIINKIPGLRNYVLNPKLDRFGDDKATGNNIVTRFLNSYINPSNVKKINLTSLDKELISIYNHMEDGDDKKYFYYNFTGNPNYDLGDGKRMSYDEAYKYGKSKRQNQTKLIERMVDSASYKNMTWKMKSDEVDSAHWISQTQADRITYGDKFAADRIDNFSDSEKKTHKKLLMMGGSDKDFVNAYIAKEKMIARCHDSSYYTKAIALASSGNKLAAKAYGIWGEKLDVANEYFSKGGSLKEYSNGMCNIISTINKYEASDKVANKAVAAAYHNINNRTRKAMGLDNQLSNMGVGLKEYGYSFDALAQMEVDALVGFDSDGNNSLKKDEVIDYIESLGLDDNVKKACIFRYFSSAKNPYGNIPNFLEMDNDDSVKSGSGGYRRYGRSYGRSGGSSGSGSSGSLESWEEFVKDFISTPTTASSSSKKSTYKSPLDEAYRAKIDKIVKNMRV